MAARTSQHTRRVARLLGPVARRYGAALALLAVATLATYAAPLVLGMGLDAATRATGAADADARSATPEWLSGLGDALARVEPERAVWTAAAIALALTLVGGALQYLRGKLIAEAAETVAKGLRDRLHAKLMRLPHTTLDEHEHGDVVQRCTSDVETTRQFVAVQAPEVARALTMLAVAFSLLATFDPELALVSVVLYPPIIALAIVFFRGIRELFQSVDEAEGRLTSVVQENLTGVRVVRAFAAADLELEKFDRANADFRERTRAWIDRLSTYWSTSDLLCLGQMLLVLAVGAYAVRAGELTVGLFFTFITTTGLTIWPVRQIGRVLTDMGKATVALERIDAILDADPEPDGERPASTALRIEVEGLRFRYREDGPLVLDGLDLALEPGRTVALVGPPGSGKSSVVEVLLKRRAYADGSVRFDGHELADLDPVWVREQIALVAQRPFLFSDTIAENLRVGRAAAEEADLERVCRQASIHGSVVELSAGYETAIGERGVDLSGGQRQRLSIARALLTDAPFLVLDDALSAVDTRTEEAILDALDDGAPRGVLLVTHRLSGAARADEIVVLDEGRVVERGAHAELLAAGGTYAELWGEQASGSTGTLTEEAAP